MLEASAFGKLNVPGWKVGLEAEGVPLKPQPPDIAVKMLLDGQERFDGRHALRVPVSSSQDGLVRLGQSQATFDLSQPPGIARFSGQ